MRFAISDGIIGSKEIRVLQDAFGVSEEEALGRLIKFYFWISRNCPDGDITGADHEGIQKAVKAETKELAMFALRKSRVILTRGEKTMVSNWKKILSAGGAREPEAGKLSFADFWRAYPRKKSKADAEKAWFKIAPTQALMIDMIAAVNKQKTSEDWKEGNGRFIPLPATWLNGRRWEDELTYKNEPAEDKDKPLEDWEKEWIAEKQARREAAK